MALRIAADCELFTLARVSSASFKSETAVSTSLSNTNLRNALLSKKSASENNQSVGC